MRTCRVAPSHGERPAGSASRCGRRQKAARFHAKLFEVLALIPTEAADLASRDLASEADP
jgi:hypothetical protein